jgi:hypothetical protein
LLAGIDPSKLDAVEIPARNHLGRVLARQAIAERSIEAKLYGTFGIYSRNNVPRPSRSLSPPTAIGSCSDTLEAREHSAAARRKGADGVEMRIISIVDRVRPDRLTDALVKATCLRDLQAARAHWEAWRQSNSLDKIDWRDQRYLVRLAKRLSTISPDCPINPRIVGLSRAMWTRSQMAVGFAARLIDALSKAGAPILLLGSAAVEAKMASQRSAVVVGAPDLQKKGWPNT